MSITEENDVRVPPAPTEPAPAPRRTRSRRGLTAVATAAIVAGTAFGIHAWHHAGQGSTPSDEQGALSRAMTDSVAEHGSIAAIDHRDQQAASSRAMTDNVAEHGSIAAIDHRDQQAASSRAMTDTVAEHGSIAAIDHRGN